MKANVFTGLGQALRWLRERQTRKQYQVADLAGITKGMLSAYETGRQRPSLDTLDKLLVTLECDLTDLHNAIQIVNGRPTQTYPVGRAGRQGTPDFDEIAERFSPFDPAGGSDDPVAHGAGELYRVLGRTPALPGPEETALAQMLDGFHRLIRYWHEGCDRLDRLDRIRRMSTPAQQLGRPPAPPAPSEPAKS